MKQTTSLSGSSLQVPIFTVRGKRIVLDSDLAALYGVPTKQLNQQVRRGFVSPDEGN